MKQYIWRKPDETWTDPTGLAAAMEAAELRILKGAGPFVITADGDPVAQALPRVEALEKLRSVMKNRPVGPVFRTRRGDGLIVFTSRAVNRAPLDDDTTNGNAKADKLWNWVNAEFPQYDPRFAGAYVCRDIAGSATLSQHAYGNAIDIFFDTLDHQDIVAKAVVDNKKLLKPYHVISRRRIWTKGQGWRAYSGDFHGHLHVDFDPQFSGPCGVKP